MDRQVPILTPEQKQLLRAAFESNAAAVPPLIPPSSLTDSSQLGEMISHHKLETGLPSLTDWSFELGVDNTSLDTSQSALGYTGSISADEQSVGHADSEGRAKRRRATDKPGQAVENAAEKQEGAPKVARKPGRKPITTEPTTKRMAQNRAAQRAFRERKEKHLKDLESKVVELQNASDSANNENQKLRSQIDQMRVEINQYKRQLSSLKHHHHSRSGGSVPLVPLSALNSADIDFVFEFPKFGVLPGPPPTGNGVKNAISDPSEYNNPITSVARMSNVHSPTTRHLDSHSTLTTAAPNIPCDTTPSQQHEASPVEHEKLSDPLVNGHAANFATVSTTTTTTTTTTGPNGLTSLGNVQDVDNIGLDHILTWPAGLENMVFEPELFSDPRGSQNATMFGESNGDSNLGVWNTSADFCLPDQVSKTQFANTTNNQKLDNSMPVPSDCDNIPLGDQAWSQPLQLYSELGSADVDEISCLCEEMKAKAKCTDNEPVGAKNIDF